MLRTFIFQEKEKSWLEESKNLLSNDLVAILDEQEKKIYLWNGPDSTRKRLEKGYESAVELISNYPDDSIQLTLLNDDIPEKIKVKIEGMRTHANLKLKTSEVQFTSLITIRIYLIMSLVCIILPIISIMNLSNFLFSPVSGETSIIPIRGYDSWLQITRVLTLITLSCFIVSIIIGIYEKEEQVIVVSLVGIIACSGIIIYLNQGIYLFIFQARTSDSYLIMTRDIALFFGLNVFAFLVFEIPNVGKFIHFFHAYRKFIFMR